jgi:hypothetical protein
MLSRRGLISSTAGNAEGVTDRVLKISERLDVPLGIAEAFDASP